MRPKFLLAVCVTAVFGLTPAYGQSVQERYVEQLKQQGFDNVTITRTWLGRTRITASSKSIQREIIFNTRSGEVLRDYWQNSDADAYGSSQVSDLLDIGSSGADGTGAEGSGGQSGDSGAGTGGAGTGGGGSGGGGDQSSLEPEFNYLTGGRGNDIFFL